MAVALTLTYAGVAAREYDRLMESLDLDASPPVGQILHAASEGADGMEAFEVWQTSGAAERYVEALLAPRVAELGGELLYEIRPLHNLFAPDLDTIERIGGVSLPGVAAGAPLRR